MNPHRARKPTDEFDNSPVKYPSQLPPTSDGKSPHVMIVGAGPAGLLLAILLEKAGIPYEIYERASSVEQLGMIRSCFLLILFSCANMVLNSSCPFWCHPVGNIAICLQSNIMAALEQLGLLEELEAISLPAHRATILYDNMKVIADFTNPNHEGE